LQAFTVKVHPKPGFCWVAGGGGGWVIHHREHEKDTTGRQQVKIGRDETHLKIGLHHIRLLPGVGFQKGDARDPGSGPSPNGDPHDGEDIVLHLMPPLQQVFTIGVDGAVELEVAPSCRQM